MKKQTGTALAKPRGIFFDLDTGFSSGFRSVKVNLCCNIFYPVFIRWPAWSSKEWVAEVAMILKYFCMCQCRDLRIWCRFQFDVDFYGHGSFYILCHLVLIFKSYLYSLMRWNGRLLKEKCGAMACPLAQTHYPCTQIFFL